MDVTPSVTILDIIESNFEAVKAKSYVLRVIYVGEHSFEDVIVLTEYFKKVAQDVNSLYCDVPVKGCLIVYRNYYVCIIEGSEETITRQILFLFGKDVDGLLEGRSKLLIVYHNILERLSAPWQSLFVDHKDLPCNLSNMDVNKKDYSPNNTRSIDLDSQYDFLEKIVNKLNQIYQDNFSGEQINSNKLSVADTNLNVYPKNGDLEIILNSIYIMDLKTYASLYGALPDYTYSFERCWPTPFDFTPKRFFDDLKMKDVFVEPLPVQEDTQRSEEKVEVVNDDDNVGFRDVKQNETEDEPVETFE